MSQQQSPSLLVVSSQVYAKGEDDTYYPGVVETREREGYLVKFTDNSRGFVLEQDLVWIGFWGLPTSSWPKRPVIQPGVSDSAVFEGRIRFVGDRAIDSPSAFTVTKAIRTGTDLVESSSSTAQHSTNEQHLHCTETTGQNETPLMRRAASQLSLRSSVLRLNPGLLRKEDQPRCFPSISFNEKPDKIHISPNLPPSAPEYFNRNYPNPKIRCQDKRKHSPHNRTNLLQGIELRSSHGELNLENEAMQKHPEQFMFTTENDKRNPNDGKEVREYRFPGNALPLPVRKPVGPSMRPISPESPLYREIYEMLSNNGSFFINNRRLVKRGCLMKKRKRSETRKCRSVYGVDNRDSWCTQCRWKKSCSRFTD